MAAYPQMLIACALVLVSTTSSANAGLSCEGLNTVQLPDTRLVALTSIVPAPVWTIDMQVFEQVRKISVNKPLCRVEGVIEKEIGFELWLPAKADWNRRFLGVGSGGSAGYINYPELARGLARGFAAALTNSGHKLTDPAWMLGHPERIRNYSDRAHHLLAQTAKQIVAAYYGQGSRHAYFIGCSGGGRQGLKEMQRYPADYDGIVAGAPGPDMPTMTVRHLMTGLMQSRHPEARLADRDWQLVADAAIATCDANDGVKDGVIENPVACSFDPGMLLCKSVGEKDCLTPGQLELVRQISAPIRDETGRPIDSGLLPGVRTRPGPPPDLVTEFFAHGVYQDPNWNPASFNIGRDLLAARKALPEIWADDPDLTGYRARGGKAIIYSGWMDPSVIAEQALNYYRRVEAAMGGAEKLSSFLRLYMAPGVFHCAGGPGPDRFGGAGGDAPKVDADHDMLSAMVNWVETGNAPERIIASRVVDGKVVRTRPLCPYPQLARYTGTGSSDSAENFRCSTP